MKLRRASDVAELASAGNSLLLAGGTEVVPLLRAGIIAADERAREKEKRGAPAAV